MGLKNKNILVTGGTGFIGSHLISILLEENCKIIIPYQDTNPNSYFFEQKLNKKTILAFCDLKNFKRTIDIVTKYEIDIIFHLAAQAIVTTAFHNPLETLETNIMGTANILEASRLYGKVQGIIVVSSDKAYGKIPKATENHPVSGDHPYETSKSAADLIATTYFKTYNLPVVVTRFGNVYGEGDLNFSRIVPGIMKAIIKNEELVIRSDGKYIRDYVYVGDVVDALMLIAKNLKGVCGEAFNISSNENLSVIELIKKIAKVLDVKIKYRILNNAINEIPVQSVDYKKIRKSLGWQLRNNLNSTISQIYDWYNKYFGRS